MEKWFDCSGFCFIFLFLFFIFATQMHILAVIITHRHKLCIYTGERKLKSLIAFANFLTFCTLMSDQQICFVL